jgi:sugar lactone lactonase YvrE
MSAVPPGHYTKIAGGFYLEGLAVAAEDAVWYSDVIAGGIHRISANGAKACYNAERMWTGGLIIDAAGHILSTGQGGIMRTDPQSGTSTWLLKEIDGKPINGINEMAPDGAGGFYFGTVDLAAINAGEAPGPASIYRLAADGVVHLAHGPLGFANGMALSADGRTLFLNESFDGTYAFDVQPDLTLANRRKLLEKEDCDGMALDVEGTLWITGFRSSDITRVRPDGTALAPVATPAGAITQIRFGGADMRDFWITAVSATAGDDLAQGKLPETEVSFLYQGRADVAGLRVPAVTVGAEQ